MTEQLRQQLAVEIMAAAFATESAPARAKRRWRRRLIIRERRHLCVILHHLTGLPCLHRQLTLHKRGSVCSTWMIFQYVYQTTTRDRIRLPSAQSKTPIFRHLYGDPSKDAPLLSHRDGLVWLRIIQGLQHSVRVGAVLGGSACPVHTVSNHHFQQRSPTSSSVHTIQNGHLPLRGISYPP